METGQLDYLKKIGYVNKDTFYDFIDAVSNFETSRPFCLEVYFESNHGCPGDPQILIDKLKSLSNNNDKLKAIKIIKHKIHNGKYLGNIASQMYFIEGKSQ